MAWEFEEVGRDLGGWNLVGEGGGLTIGDLFVEGVFGLGVCGVEGDAIVGYWLLVDGWGGEWVFVETDGQAGLLVVCCWLLVGFGCGGGF